MQRNQPEPRKNRTNAERDAAQPMAGQPRTDDEEDELQDPEQVPSFLTARELQARDPARGEKDGSDAGERHASAEFAGEKGEPPITDDEPARAGRGMPLDRSDDLLKKGRKGK